MPVSHTSAGACSCAPCHCNLLRCSRERTWSRVRKTRSRFFETLLRYDGLDFIRHLTNFGRSVLGCIEAYDSENRRIFSAFFKIYTLCVPLHHSKLNFLQKNSSLFSANFAIHRCKTRFHDEFFDEF